MADSPGFEQPCPTCGKAAGRSASGLLSAGLTIRHHVKLPSLKTSTAEKIARLEKKDEKYAASWNTLRQMAKEKQRTLRTSRRSDSEMRITGSISPEKRLALKLKHGADYVNNCPDLAKREGRSFE